MPFKETDLHNENIETLLDKRALAWKPGQNGRPPNYGSITYWYKQLLQENRGIAARQIAQAVIERSKSGSMPHIVELLDRVEGKVASDVNVRGVMLHVGDDYAREGIAAIKEDMAVRLASLSPQSPQQLTEGIDTDYRIVDGITDNEV